MGSQNHCGCCLPAGVGDPASYPYYGMPVGMPPQYFSGTVGAAPQMAYYYPMAYPNMPQYVWVPYMPGAGYPAPGYGAPGRTLLSDADASQGSSSSVTRLESSDGHGRQVPGAPHIKDGSSKVFYGTVSHSHLQGGDAHPGSAPLVDSEQSVSAKRCTCWGPADCQRMVTTCLALCPMSFFGATSAQQV